MRFLVRWVFAAYIYFNAQHVCKPCHVKSGPLPDVVLETSSGTQGNDPTPNDANTDDDDDLQDS